MFREKSFILEGKMLEDARGLESGRALGNQDPERMVSARQAEKKRLAFWQNPPISESSANAREVKTKPQRVVCAA